MKKKIISILLLNALFTCIISGCSVSDNNKSVSKSGFYFDTIITITLYGTSDDSLINDCFTLAGEYEDLLSNTIDGSDISNINDHPGEFVSVDEKTLEVLEDALYYCELSDGAFDITIGNLTDLWNISSLAENSDEGNEVDSSLLPSSSEIASALSHVNYKNVIISGNTVELADPEAKIDLGGIAKGYIADQMKILLNEEGVTEGVINLGGNILTIGEKSSQEPYNIGVQRPFSDSGEVSCSVKLADGTLVTSGIYERYIKVNGTIYHHILDVNTGYPADTDLYSVTIICDNSAKADALSTTVLLKGLNAGKDFIEGLDGVEAIFIDKDENITYTSGLEGLVTIE